MTPSQRKFAIAVLTIVFGGAILGAASAVQENVIFRPEFEKQSAILEGKLNRVLDVLCADKPTIRQCQP